MVNITGGGDYPYYSITPSSQNQRDSLTTGTWEDTPLLGWGP